MIFSIFLMENTSTSNMVTSRALPIYLRNRCDVLATLARILCQNLCFSGGLLKDFAAMPPSLYPGGGKPHKNYAVSPPRSSLPLFSPRFGLKIEIAFLNPFAIDRQVIVSFASSNSE